LAHKKKKLRNLGAGRFLKELGNIIDLDLGAIGSQVVRTDWEF
jgi:hypothetical protein